MLHLASPASPPEYLSMPLETLDVSSIGTRRALDLARANDAPFLLASTSEIYGDPLVHPQSEAYLGNVDPVGPRAVYDEAKRFAETLTMTYHRLYDLPTRIVRIFNTYGPRLRPADGRVVSNFLVQAIDGEPLHDLRHAGRRPVRSASSTTRCAASSRCSTRDVVEPVNIGNPIEFTMLELAELVCEVTGARARVRVRAAARRAIRRGASPTSRARSELLGLGAEDRAARRARAHARLVPGGARPWTSVTARPPKIRKLSVIVPVYNERNTVVEVLRRMRAVELPDGDRSRDHRGRRRQHRRHP